MTEQQQQTVTPAQADFRRAMREANVVAARLSEEGEESRLAGLVVAVDLGVSAAFMFSVTDADYRSATEIVRMAIVRATREGND